MNKTRVIASFTQVSITCLTYIGLSRFEIKTRNIKAKASYIPASQLVHLCNYT